MKFIEVAHPEGGRYLINIDHIASSHYRPANGSTKARLGIDIDKRQNEIVLFDDEAERVWNALRQLVFVSSAA